MEAETTLFFSQHASAIFALVGAFAGGMLSFFGSLILKNRDFKLRLWDQLAERKIKAHENVIELAVAMRVMMMLGGDDENGELRRSPQVLISKQEFESWFTRFTQLSLQGTTWLSVDAKRELNFVQDYLVTLHERLRPIPSDKYLAVGVHIKNDFIDLSSSLEKAAFRFFETGVDKLALESLDEWHKYERSVTIDRLEKTQLRKRWELVNSYAEFETE